MKGQDKLFSHNSDEWETPQWLFSLMDDEFNFIIDAAANNENTKCENFFSLKTSAFIVDWTREQELLKFEEEKTAIWLNPPYSQIGAFIAKAFNESLKGATVVCLIPSRTDTKYWHDYVMASQEIRFIRGRLKFENKSLPSWRADGSMKISSAPFPSCVVIFRNHYGTTQISRICQP